MLECRLYWVCCAGLLCGTVLALQGVYGLDQGVHAEFQPTCRIVCCLLIVHAW